MFEWKRLKMKRVQFVTAGLLIIFLLSFPVVADAEWHHGGGAFLGFGAGLITGYLFAPRPVSVASPVYVPPPPVVQIYPDVAQASPDKVPVPPPELTPPPAMAPPPPAPSTSGYSGSSTAPAPGNQETCREWKMIDRHMEDRWDSYSGRWQQVAVERWGWVEVPCDN